MNDSAQRDDARELICFVVGPIGDRDAEVGTAERKIYEDAIEIFEHVIEPACAAYAISVVRADRIAKPGEIPDQVFRYLRDSYLVIADVTGGNPNVMYELGLRHTTGKLTIQLGERGRLPFDVSVIRTILFKRTEGRLIEARRELSAAIGAGMEGGGDPVSATRVWFEAHLTTEPALPASSGEPDDDDEPGFLEKVADMSLSLDTAAVNLETLTGVLSEITSIISDSTSEIAAVNASGADPQARLALANALASRIAEPASRLEVVVGEYRASVERIDPGLTYLLGQAEAERGSEAAESFRERVREMISAVEALYASAEGYRNVAAVTADASRSLRKVYRRIMASTDRLLDTKRLFDKWKRLLDSDGAC